MRALIMASLLCAAPTPVLAQETAPAPAVPAVKSYNTAETDIGTLLDDPAAKAILDKYLPGFSANPQVGMARGMTLKAVQQYAPEQFTDKALAAIDADLAKLPVKK